MKLSPEVKEIIAAEADFVSLVDRPANRIPFRIMKSEDGVTATLTKEDKSMSIDLGRIGQLLTKKAPAAPAITTFVISKTVPGEAADKIVTDAGFSTEHKSETADAYVYKQAEIKEGDAVVQLTDTVAITVTGLSKAFYDYDYQSASFDIVNATNGFYPSLFMGMNALETTVSNILNKSYSAGEAKPQIKDALADFVKYASMVVDSLPEQAFKAEVIAKSADLSGVTRTTAVPSGIAQSPMSSEADKPQEVRTESPEPRRVSPDPGHHAQTNTDSAETGPAEKQNPEANHQAAQEAVNQHAEHGTAANLLRDPEAERIEEGVLVRDLDVATANTQVAAENRAETEVTSTNKDDPELGELKKMMASLVQTVTSSQADTASQLKALGDRIAKSEQVLSGTVTAPAPTEVTPVSKSASAGAPPLLDTAFGFGD